MLRFTNTLATNADPAYREIVAYVSQTSGIPIEFVDDVAWPERIHQLDAGLIDGAWICGAPYVRRKARGEPIELLVAPVMQGERYGDRPIYFSDIIVRQDSSIETFDDLAGCRWGFNEIVSHSGYTVVKYELARRGLTMAYFGEWVEAGTHQNAIAMVAAGKIDAAAIDNTVLTTEIQQHPKMAERIRTIGAIGPSPMLPWIISAELPLNLRQTIRHTMLTMHKSSTGRAILHRANYHRFATVTDSDYDLTRHMLAVASHVKN